MADKTKIAALILAKRKPSAESAAESEPDGSTSAAEELIAAVKDGDAAGVVEAFKALYDSACGSEG